MGPVVTESGDQARCAYRLYGAPTRVWGQFWTLSREIDNVEKNTLEGQTPRIRLRVRARDSSGLLLNT